MNVGVVRAMKLIRDEAKSAQGAEIAPLVAAAVEVANAYEEALNQSSIVSISSGSMISADEIAEKVVARFDIVAAERVKVPALPGMSPLPWRYNEMGCIFSGPENENEVEVVDLWMSRDGVHVDGRAIVEAVNAYFSGGLQPHSPAQTATANSETQLPDTAGYPVDIPAAAEVPDRAGEKLQKAFNCEAISVVHGAYVKALNMASCKEERVALSLEGMRFAIAVLWMEAQLPAGELQPVNEAVQSYAADLVGKAYRSHRAGQSPNAA